MGKAVRNNNITQCRLTTLPDPCSVDSTTAPYLTFLQHHLLAPLLLIDSIDISTGFNAESTSRSSRRQTFLCRRGFNKLTRVELKRRLCAESFKVDVCVGMGKFDELLDGFCARVEWDARRIGIHNEAVIWVGFLRTEDELFLRFEFGIGFDGAGGNGRVVDG